MLVKRGGRLHYAVLNKGVADEGTGSRVGGKPGPQTVALVRDLMEKAGLTPGETANVQRAFGARAAAPSPAQPQQPAQAQSPQK